MNIWFVSGSGGFVGTTGPEFWRHGGSDRPGYWLVMLRRWGEWHAVVDDFGNLVKVDT